MYGQTLPSSASAYDRQHRTEIAAASSAVQRLWRRMGPDFDATYARIEDRLLSTVLLAQQRLADAAQDYLPAVLDETDQRRAVTPAARVSTAPLIGVAGDGRPVDSLLYGAVTTAKARVAEGASPFQALRAGGQWLGMAAGTILADTSRASLSLGIGVRPVSGMVRMVNPGACSRCIILAGRWYRKNAAFLRHPRCQCTAIPSSEALAGDLTTDPQAHFESLSPAEQDRVFTKAGAEAIRAGADINQVVNARRGMWAAQSGRMRPVTIAGREVYITLEGTTRRGRAYQAMSRARYVQRQGELVRAGQRYRAWRAPRLMPESIAQIATSREDYLRLLRLYGYIL